ncbi:sigma-70 family RNA polymerase sigma factor [Pseudonocardia alaniniphila]|uniref:Sigma-70 family RNA polymerase sigma factor n=1 Tax=Pseudonocardia alaniniphila TaxID=75291 RepID=A0ABS9T774_9PSEU|nr:sigma-70 family RNA polymerase sigma factor [Pseudonocardia alaniniphila]MCH6164288.1 sigma-70 family RNA polymerase sigma factor [Pseudonocardia alaniniphila]
MVASLPDCQESTEAFVRGLYEDAFRPLLRFVLPLTGSRERAEEVVQETMVRAWRQHATGFESGRPHGWLYTVARNLVTDLRRHDAIRPVIVHDEIALKRASESDPFEKAVHRRVVADALNQLRPKHRDVLIAIYYQDCSLAEAAHRLGIPVGTVKSRSYHALRELRGVLEQSGAL